MSDIDYFFSPLSPFPYLVGNDLETNAAHHGVRITCKPGTTP